jgi:hypothetical protein
MFCPHDFLFFAQYFYAFAHVFLLFRKAIDVQKFLSAHNELFK